MDNLTTSQQARKRERQAKARDARAKDYYDMLALNEGKKDKVYLDSKGIPSIGIGFNLNEAHNKKFLKKMGIDRQALLDGRRLSDKEIKAMYNHSLTQAFNDARAYDKDFNSRPHSVQKGLVDMAFGLGLTKLNKFKLMKEGLEANDYAKVAREAQDSDWFKDVKSRGPRTVGLFKEAIQ